MHFVGLALEPFEEPADAVPTIGLVIFLRVFAGAFLAVDDEILVVLWQFLERQMHIDLLPGAGPEQVLLRFTHLFTAKNTDGALGDGEGAIGNGAVEIDCDRASEAAAFGTGA